MLLEAPVRRYICIELPDENKSVEDEVGLLDQGLHGTRDAAANFQAEVHKFIAGVGFLVSRYNASTLRPREKELRYGVHGDDFVTCGGPQDVQWFRWALEERFEVSTAVIGTGKGEAREGNVLDRVIRVE